MNTKPTTADKTKSPAASDKEIPSKPSPFDPWAFIEVGSIVLSRSDPKEGWFECKVVALGKNEQTLILKWRDYPSFPEFEVKRKAVGLLCMIK